MSEMDWQARAQTAEAERDELAKDDAAHMAAAEYWIERAQTAEAALRDLAQKLKLPSSRALVREALAHIDEHPTQEAVDDHD